MVKPNSPPDRENGLPDHAAGLRQVGEGIVGTTIWRHRKQQQHGMSESRIRSFSYDATPQSGALQQVVQFGDSMVPCVTAPIGKVLLESKCSQVLEVVESGALDVDELACRRNGLFDCRQSLRRSCKCSKKSIGISEVSGGKCNLVTSPRNASPQLEQLPPLSEEFNDKLEHIEGGAAPLSRRKVAGSSSDGQGREAGHADADPALPGGIRALHRRQARNAGSGAAAPVTCRGPKASGRTRRARSRRPDASLLTNAARPSITCSPDSVPANAGRIATAAPPAPRGQGRPVASRRGTPCPSDAFPAGCGDPRNGKSRPSSTNSFARGEKPIRAIVPSRPLS